MNIVSWNVRVLGKLAKHFLAFCCCLLPPRVQVGVSFTGIMGGRLVALVNTVWMEHFPRVSQNSLPRLGSDHVPIRLEVGQHYSNPRPFKFEIVWDSTEGFKELI